MDERCDRCGPYVSAAYRFEHGPRLLDFCLHDATHHIDALTTAGWEMHILPAHKTLAAEAKAGGRALAL